MSATSTVEAETPALGRVPTTIDPAVDLAAKPPGGGSSWSDSIFVCGQVQADGHDLALHADGTHELVPVTPLAQDAGRLLDNPGSPFVFPTEWVITIPSRDTRLTVTTTIVDQEVPGLGGLSVYEGAATYIGTYLGGDVSGRTYVEQLGNWSP